MRNILIVTLFCILLSSCTLYQINSEDKALDYYPPKENQEEIEYIENVNRTHDIIGLITINAERNQSMKEILKKMQNEARQLGADAITNIRTNDGTGKWARIKPKLFKNSNVRANFIADAVVFK